MTRLASTPIGTTNPPRDREHQHLSTIIGHMAVEAAVYGGLAGAILLMIAAVA